MIVAPVPIHGRMALWPWTIHRLTEIGVTPLCIVDRDQERYLAEKYGWPVKQVKKMPLGQKWNIGFRWAEKYNPEAVLYVGSSDWVSENWIDFFLPMLKQYDMVGVKGIHHLHRAYFTKPFPNTLKHFIQRLGYWSGYTGERAGESCGGGRMLSSRILDKIGWSPFDDTGVHNMDCNMLNAVKDKGGKVFTYDGNEVKGLSISSDLWPNMHDFTRDISFEIFEVGEFLKNNFKTGLELWNVDGVYSQILKQ